MLDLPLKPLLHIAFVSVSLFIFLVIFLSFLLHCLSVRALEQTHSLPSFGLWDGWSDLAMCVAVCVGLSF
jgi:hypothetical protein